MPPVLPAFFKTEPKISLSASPRIGVLLCNLGTPEQPSAGAVRRYLGEFLSDQRVVELPKWLWLPILHGIILRTRPRRLAHKYAAIWMAQGSPLKVWTERQAQALQKNLQNNPPKHSNITVRFAMRYGKPSIETQLDWFKTQAIEHILIVPLYPQYSGTTTASVIDAVSTWAQGIRRVPEMRFINHYPDEPHYIAALAQRVQTHWQTQGKPDKLLMSFHGLPLRTIEQGDPYHAHCLRTVHGLAAQLGLSENEYAVSFQSRFGAEKWLSPSTESTLVQLAREGTQRVDVICPGFPADCLETLEEIAQEGREVFLKAGGKSFHYIECLNDSPAWIDALANMVQTHIAGWRL